MTTDEGPEPVHLHSGEKAPLQTRMDGSKLLELDTKFYGNFYEDLKELDEAALSHHWLEHGQHEERFPSFIVWLKAQGYEQLPGDFSVEFYRWLNPDVAEVHKSDLGLMMHFASKGKSENRKFLVDISSNIVRSFAADYAAYSFEGELKTLVKGDSLTSFLARHDIFSLKFLEKFDYEDYQARVGASRCKNFVESVVHFIANGQYNNIPIGSEYRLDTEVYSEFAPEILTLSPIAAYRHWINVGIESDWPINSVQLMNALGLPGSQIMPEDFHWRSYLRANPDLQKEVKSPWRALQHFALNGIPEKRSGCTPSKSTAPLYVQAADRLAIQNNLLAARQLYETALLADPTNTQGLRHYGDCLMRLGDWFGAIAIYRQTISSDRYNAWTFLNLAKCLSNVNRKDQTITVLQEAHKLYAGDQYIQELLLQAQEDYYYNVSSIANDLASSAFYAEAVRSMHDAVHSLTKASEDRGIYLPREGWIKNIGIVADMSIPQCKYYRVAQKKEHLELAGYTVEIFDQTTDLSRFHKRLPYLNAVIFYRVAALPQAVRAFRAVKKAGVPSFYDIDDLIFDHEHFPDSFESYGGQISREVYGGLVTGTELFKKGIELCDFALSSTRQIASRMEDLVRKKRTFIHRNALSVAEVEFSKSVARKHSKKSGIVRIFYGTGTRAHNSDFEQLAAPALIALLEKYTDKIQITIVGYLTLPPEFEKFSDRIVRVEELLDRSSYFALLSEMDINIAVLNPTVVTDGKSEIKWMEAALFGIPSVVSNTENYRDVVEHKKTALLAENLDDWYSHIELLIEDEGLRNRIGSSAQKQVFERYSPDTMANNWKDIVRQVEGSFSIVEPAGRLPIKVVIVNVFFPPQAIGGATRVVADNVNDLQALYGSEIEIEVFATIEGGRIPYEEITYQWEGVRVTGVTTPTDPDIDLRVGDVNMAAIFGRHLDRIQPDIVHFHCIQRLTPAICREALSRHIPYFVTVHDGWWVSHDQFLLDKNNQVSQYNYEDPISILDTSNGIQKLSRMKSLMPALVNAKQILAVSQPFAEIYRQCGLNNVSVVENGVSNLPVVERVKGSGKVRIAHVGGKSFHKGFNHLRAALTDTACENIEVMLIDHSFSPGMEVVSMWGKSKVIIRGKFPQTEVAHLYAQTDVLLAPSFWPESYGLVVREALQAGCWVVVSDRGALSDPVTDECGFVVSVDSYDDLKRVLGLINSQPDRFSMSPKVRNKQRTSVDQARDLMAIYRAVREN